MLKKFFEKLLSILYRKKGVGQNECFVPRVPRVLIHSMEDYRRQVEWKAKLMQSVIDNYSIKERVA